MGQRQELPRPPPRYPQACGPTVHHACNENMHLAGFCFLWTSSSWQTQRLPDALQGECLGPGCFEEPTHISLEA